VTEPTITPALTAAEWDGFVGPGVRRGNRVITVSRVVKENGYGHGQVLVIEATGKDNLHVALPFLDADCHALAALALHGQPFGFTREDVALLRDEAESEWNGDEMPTGRRLLALAARIEALLPPEGK
jgi:hypothetical protein